MIPVIHGCRPPLMRGFLLNGSWVGDHDASLGQANLIRVQARAAAPNDRATLNVGLGQYHRAQPSQHRVRHPHSRRSIDDGLAARRVLKDRGAVEQRVQTSRSLAGPSRLDPCVRPLGHRSSPGSLPSCPGRVGVKGTLTLVSETPILHRGGGLRGGARPGGCRLSCHRCRGCRRLSSLLIPRDEADKSDRRRSVVRPSSTGRDAPNALGAYRRRSCPA
jgi:hypothetical protein